MKYNLVIGGIIAYLLLGLYSGITAYAIFKVIECAQDSSCSRVDLHPGLIYTQYCRRTGISPGCIEADNHCARKGSCSFQERRGGAVAAGQHYSLVLSYYLDIYRAGHTDYRSADLSRNMQNIE